MTQGIVYIATNNDVIRSGKSFVDEAEISASKARKYTDVPITLVTDQPPRAGDIFDDVIELPDPDHGWRDKIKSLKKSPYSKTLFLDTDTHISGDIESLFEILDSFELAVAHDPSHGEREHPNVPVAFPEFNTGVLVYKDNNKVNNLFQDWLDIFDAETESWISGDQPSFREALYNSEIRFATLTREWNCRYTHPGMIAGSPRILHGRNPQPERAKEILKPNSIYRPTWFSLRSYNPKTYLPPHLKYVKRKLKRDGVHSTIRAIHDRIL